ncbi:MAG: hypothetical protein ACK504_00360 [Bacteroidota bacterium]
MKTIASKLKINIFLFFFIIGINVLSQAQILTSSPYSRYGLGELNSQTFAGQAAMGNSFIAYQLDSIAPFFINIANPASLAGLKLTVFELGGQIQFTNISNSTSFVKKTNSNFSYGSIGFPLKKFGGAAFGVMPYSTAGYKITSLQDQSGIGSIKYIYNGDGGINKAFIGLGVKPFKKFENKLFKLNLADSTDTLKQIAKNKRKKIYKQFISNISIGATANYLFGSINQTTDLIYPSSTLYFNSKRQRSTQVNDFVFNGGIQTNFTIDSVRSRGKRRALKQKVIIGTGFFINTPASLKAKENNIVYNYSLDGFGTERPKDTVLNSENRSGTIKLPIEIGFGLSFKKGEKLTILLDASKTNWSDYKNFDSPNTEFTNSYRLSAGLNYVPNKLAFGASNYIKRIHYRIGASYTSGYLDLKNTKIRNYSITAGLGLPVGIGRFDEIGIVNISAQFGKLGTTTNNLLLEEYVRLNIGFTFNKRWFIKFKYD